MTTYPIKGVEDNAAMRRQFGGSSEVGALFGVGYDNMPSRWSLWAVKSGKMEAPPLDDDDRVFMGKVIEPAIAALVRRKTGWDIYPAGVYAVKDGADGKPDMAYRMGATIDYSVSEHEDGPGIIECKNRDFIRWKEDYTDDDASMRDRLQLAHQFACLPGMKWGVVAVLVGGNELKLYRYTRAAMATMIADIEAAWLQFWRDVDAGNEPKLDEGEVPAWLSIHPERPEQPAVVDVTDPTFDQDCATYLSNDATAKAAAKIAAAARARIIQAIEKHGGARSNQYRVRATYIDVPEAVINRKAYQQIRLNFDFDPRPAMDPDAKAATLRAAEAFQAPQKPKE